MFWLPTWLGSINRVPRYLNSTHQSVGSSLQNQTCNINKGTPWFKQYFQDTPMTTIDFLGF